jgi:hypothetical protein
MVPLAKTKATKEEKKTEGIKAGKDAPPTNLGWDSHSAVVCRSRICLKNKRQQEVVVLDILYSLTFLVHNVL